MIRCHVLFNYGLMKQVISPRDVSVGGVVKENGCKSKPRDADVQYVYGLVTAVFL